MPSPPAADRLHRVSCSLGYDVVSPITLALQIAPAASIGLTTDEHLEISSDRTGPCPIHERATEHGGRVHLVKAGPGRLTVEYTAGVRSRAPEALQLSDQTGPLAATDDLGLLDAEALTYLRQSRYCPSDAMSGFAATEFANHLDEHDLAATIASWVFERLAYVGGVSGPLDTALDSLMIGVGVCRDYAHVAIALCRALGVPARLVAVYAPGLSPMDFHAVVEARRPGGWEVLDPTRLAPRSSLLRIATGRDAADTAFATVLDGEAEPTYTEVSAVVDGDLPADDHVAAISLG